MLQQAASRLSSSATRLPDIRRTTQSDAGQQGVPETDLVMQLAPLLDRCGTSDGSSTISSRRSSAAHGDDASRWSASGSLANGELWSAASRMQQQVPGAHGAASSPWQSNNAA